ncbi:zinc finger protein [Theobroma cacao]|nr:zinc finger protein [Theobroma cacao]
MFALKTTIEKDVLEHIRDAETPKEAWDTLVTLFSKKNDTRLQLLENELLSAMQRDMMNAQYFHKMKRIIIHGLRPEYRGFVTAVQGWPNQPSLVEFENLLADQEDMAKQMGGVSFKGKEEAFYASKSRGNFKQHIVGGSKKNDDKVKSHQGKGSFRSGEASKNRSNNKRFEGKCYNCGKRGHMAKVCWSSKKFVENYAAIPNTKEKNEDDWGVEAFFTIAKEELALTVTTSEQINYENDWIVVSGCEIHMTGDK